MGSTDEEPTNKYDNAEDEEMANRTTLGKAPFQKAWKKHIIGYPRLAERMAIKPQTRIFRRFDSLNARNLLYMQAELCMLENELPDMERFDNDDKDADRKKFAVDFKLLLESGEQQLKLVQKIQSRLRQYNKALIQQSILQQLKHPDRFDLYDVQRFIYSDDMGPCDMIGEDRDTWGDPDDPNNHPLDLISLKPHQKEDKFSRWIAEMAIILLKCGFDRLKIPARIFGRRVYYDSRVLKATFWITSISASLLPMVSMILHITVHSLKASLAIIASVNVLISICLTVFTDAKRTDVFMVTAIYAAVQFMFIGTITPYLRDR